MSKNKYAKWNLVHYFLIIFYFPQSFLYVEAKFDEHTSS